MLDTGESASLIYRTFGTAQTKSHNTKNALPLRNRFVPDAGGSRHFVRGDENARRTHPDRVVNRIVPWTSVTKPQEESL